MKTKIGNILLICLYALVIVLFLLFPIRGSLESSPIEYRTLEKVPNFNFKEFYEGSFQEKLEKAISDQMLLSSELRVFNKQLSVAGNLFATQILSNAFQKQDVYINISKDYFTYGHNSHLLSRPHSIGTLNFDNKAAYFNSIDCEKYIYYIEKDTTVDFNDVSKKEQIYDQIVSKYHADGIGRFEINSYEEFEKYFYQTDHHWNHLGSYKGYTEIIRMLLGQDEKLIEPVETVQFDYIFRGSADRSIQSSMSNEKFTVYRFNDIDLSVEINGTPYDSYGLSASYFEGTNYVSKYTNHYGEFYGADYAEVVFDSPRDNGENLLVLCTSYSNAVKELIAMHFDKTYFVDLRYFNDFNINDYIKENGIDKVLILGDIYSFVW